MERLARRGFVVDRLPVEASGIVRAEALTELLKNETRRALAEMLPQSENPYDGKCLEYRNPVTGGSTFPTFSCWIQMLDGGKETQEHRHTSNQLYYVVEGSGTSALSLFPVSSRKSSSRFGCSRLTWLTRPSMISSSRNRTVTVVGFPAWELLNLWPSQ